jgi:hypothetical protein
VGEPFGFNKVTKESLSTQLRSFYAKTKRQVNLGEYEFVLENLFGIENLKAIIADQFEGVFQDYFVLGEVDTAKKELFSYSDIYDFLNTILGIDPDDFQIFFTHEEMQEYSVSLMNVLNRAFNAWSQNHKSGFRKGTRVFFEMDKVGIHLYLKPEIKT